MQEKARRQPRWHTQSPEEQILESNTVNTTFLLLPGRKREPPSLDHVPSARTYRARLRASASQDHRRSDIKRPCRTHTDRSTPRSRTRLSKIPFDGINIRILARRDTDGKVETHGASKHENEGYHRKIDLLGACPRWTRVRSQGHSRCRLFVSVAITDPSTRRSNPQGIASSRGSRTGCVRGGAVLWSEPRCRSRHPCG
jgi:hypothetical protein